MGLILGIMLILAVYFVGSVFVVARVPTVGIWTWIKWIAVISMAAQIVCMILIGAGVIG